MKRPHLEAEGLHLLRDCVTNGVAAFHAVPDASGTPELKVLLGDGTWLRIVSKMHDLDDWEEVGVLAIEPCAAPAARTELGQHWAQPLKIDILTVEGEDCFAESGIILSSATGEFVAVAADMPFSLALKAPGYEGRFEPECDLSSYTRIPYGRP